MESLGQGIFAIIVMCTVKIALNELNPEQLKNNHCNQLIPENHEAVGAH